MMTRDERAERARTRARLEVYLGFASKDTDDAVRQARQARYQRDPEGKRMALRSTLARIAFAERNLDRAREDAATELAALADAAPIPARRLA